VDTLGVLTMQARPAMHGTFSALASTDAKPHKTHIPVGQQRGFGRAQHVHQGCVCEWTPCCACCKCTFSQHTHTHTHTHTHVHTHAHTPHTECSFWYTSLFVTSFLLLVHYWTSLTGPFLSAGKGVYDIWYQSGFLFLNHCGEWISLPA